MSDYRIFDKNKNTYDAEILDTLPVVTPHDFNVVYEITDDTSKDGNFRNINIRITAKNKNPQTGNYAVPEDITVDNQTSIVYPIDGNYYWVNSLLSEYDIYYQYSNVKVSNMVIYNDSDFPIRLYSFGRNIAPQSSNGIVQASRTTYSGGVSSTSFYNAKPQSFDNYNDFDFTLNPHTSFDRGLVYDCSKGGISNETITHSIGTTISKEEGITFFQIISSFTIVRLTS